MLGTTGRVLGRADGNRRGSGPAPWELAVPYADSSYCAVAPRCEPMIVYSNSRPLHTVLCAVQLSVL
jgi:hypothetical protein